MSNQQVQITKFLDKVEYCGECGHWRRGRCAVGYMTSEDSRPCRQAVHKRAFRRVGI